MYPEGDRDVSDASILTNIFYGNSASRSQKHPNDHSRRGGNSESASVSVPKVNLDQKPIEWEDEVLSQNKHVGPKSKIKNQKSINTLQLQ